MSHRLALGFVPALVLFALLFCSAEVGRFLAQLVGMPFHELGHAVASWLGGHAALPLPFFTFWLEDSSLWVTLLSLGLSAWIARACWLEYCWFAFGTASGFFLATLICSFGLDATQSRQLQVLGGPLGELLLPWLCLATFYFPLPAAWRWDFPWRFPLALPAAFAFAQAYVTWLRGAADPSLLPWGSALGEASDGDLNRLVDSFGFTPGSLIALVLLVAHCCLGGLLLVSVWPLVRSQLALRGLLPTWLDD